MYVSMLNCSYFIPDGPCGPVARPILKTIIEEYWNYNISDITENTFSKTSRPYRPDRPGVYFNRLTAIFPARSCSKTGRKQAGKLLHVDSCLVRITDFRLSIGSTGVLFVLSYEFGTEPVSCFSLPV